MARQMLFTTRCRAIASFIMGSWWEEEGEQQYMPLMVHGPFLDARCTLLQTEVIEMDETTAVVQQLKFS